MSRRLDLRSALLVLMTVILGGWAVRATAVVLVPLVAAILIALAVMPVRDWVRHRVPSAVGWLGHTAAMALILLVLVLFFGGLWLAAQEVLREMPSSPAQMIGTLQGTTVHGGQASVADAARAGAAEATKGDVAANAQSASERDGLPDGLTGTAGRISQMLWNGVTGAAGGVAVVILSSALGIVAGLSIIFFLTLLILVESDDWRRKLQAISRPHIEGKLLESAEVISGKLQAYLLMKVALSLLTAALYMAWLWFWGVGLIFVWGLLAFFLNLIPAVGSFAAGVLPVVYALVTQDWGTALIVGAGILVIEQVMGNYAAPKLEGSHIALSPLVILVALIFWSWIWGVAGALLAVPVTVSLVVLAAHVPALRPWALLLTNRTTMRGLEEVTRPE